MSERLNKNPFLTDEELARSYSVSVQTIRLDRLELGIPELRERIKHVAEQKLEQAQHDKYDDVSGQIAELQLEQSAVSILEISEEHIAANRLFALAQYIFAQANSLANAVINAELALTEAARIRFIRPVKLRDRLVATAVVRSLKNDRARVDVETRVDNELVFSGSFLVFKMVDTRGA